MPIYMPDEKPRELPPAGAHTAICIYVVDLGTQETSFGQRRQVFIGWELPDERTSAGAPFTIGRRYTYSSNSKAALRADIESWIGRPLSGADFGRLNLSDFLGRTCLLGVKHETKGERTHANVHSVLKPPKGTPERLSASIAGVELSLDARPFDPVSYDALPNWLKDTIGKSPEYQAAINPEPEPPKRQIARRTPAPMSEVLNDDVPF